MLTKKLVWQTEGLGTSATLFLEGVGFSEPILTTISARREFHFKQAVMK